MISGFFVDNVPWIEVILTWRDVLYKTAVILDTGFSGDVQVSPKIAKQLLLPAFGTSDVRIANGAVVKTPVVLAATNMEGVHMNIRVLVSEGPPLAGINFLSKFAYKAIVDCKNKTVALAKVR